MLNINSFICLFTNLAKGRSSILPLKSIELCCKSIFACSPKKMDHFGRGLSFPQFFPEMIMKSSRTPEGSALLLSFSCFSLLNPLRSTLFLDIPILAFVSRSRDRVENFLQHLCENDRSRYKGKKHILHLHLRSGSCLRKTTFKAFY